MRSLTRNESIGLIALLTLVTGIVGYSALQAGRAATSPGITIREAFPQPPAAAPVLAPSPSTSAIAPSASSPPMDVAVHVAGAVKKPGVYHLPINARNDDALQAAGGPTKDANTDAINLAAHVEDGSRLYIPTRTEHPDGGAPAEAVSPASDAKKGAASSPHRAAKGGEKGNRPGKLTDPGQGKVNLNTADVEELQRLPGIGPAMAERLIAFRKENGGFKSVEDLLQVSGIGDKKFAKIQPFVRVR